MEAWKGTEESAVTREKEGQREEMFFWAVWNRRKRGDSRMKKAAEEC